MSAADHECDPIECGHPAHGPMYPPGHPAMRVESGAHGLPQMMPANPAEIWSHVYTLAELAEDTEGILAKIAAHGPSLLTRHGRFVAMIVPMDEEAPT